MKLKNIIYLLFCFATFQANAQSELNTNKFKQLGQELPTPNVYRTADGKPGHLYWQQKVDYIIEVKLDDEKQQIYGEEEITYTNNSPNELEYLWVQLDQNVRHPDSDKYKTSTQDFSEGVKLRDYYSLFNGFPGGFNLDYVQDANGKDLNPTINNTMMRIDLEQPLVAGASTKIKIKWWYNINDRMEIGGRSGYEYFKEDDNYLYTIAQFFPRMAVYSDVEGWQNKQFLGRGEFALPFGDYDVKITLPDDMVVGATGEIQNKSEVLSPKQITRLEQAAKASSPVLIISQEEAEQAEKTKSNKEKTWHFTAENVRDFGWAASRKFIWDAQGVPMGDRTVMAMSLYPKEGNPLWEKYSTKAIVLSLEVYSKHTFDYPYPVAYSVHAKSIGMEYPMICFNFGRPDKDGKYSNRVKYGMIGVIIHEIGHNYFPMIVNSDERQWTWMDEGLNVFLQYMTEKEWTDETGKPFQSRRGPAEKIVNYMKGDKSNISPIMTNSESIFQFGNNAYGKPATALNILRESIMGPELFDHAFKTYANRWMFKHPSPADFFRTMEDASAVDLDWFWRGWFYTNNHVDISLDEVTLYKLNLKNRDEIIVVDPELKSSKKTKRKRKNKKTLSLNTKYFDPIFTEVKSKEDVNAEYKTKYDNLSERKKALLDESKYFYQLDFTNVGGLVMPIILQFNYSDDTSEIIKLPAEVWKKEDSISKVFITDKEIKQVILDPNKELADTDKSNNYWPSFETPINFK